MDDQRCRRPNSTLEHVFQITAEQGVVQRSFKSPVMLHTLRTEPLSNVFLVSDATCASTSRWSEADRTRDLAANNALGFQKILTLFIRPSWRSRGLKAAASLADLDVEIPDHNPLADELVNAFSNIGDKHKVLALPPTGAAGAWLSHLKSA